MKFEIAIVGVPGRGFPAALSRVVRPDRGKEVVHKFCLIPELGGHTPEVDEVIYKGVPRQLAYRGRPPTPDAQLRANVHAHAPPPAALLE